MLKFNFEIVLIISDALSCSEIKFQPEHLFLNLSKTFQNWDVHRYPCFEFLMLGVFYVYSNILVERSVEFIIKLVQLST